MLIIIMSPLQYKNNMIPATISNECQVANKKIHWSRLDNLYVLNKSEEKTVLDWTVWLFASMSYDWLKYYNSHINQTHIKPTLWLLV